MNKLLLALGIYLICWVFAYVLVNGDFNLKYMYEYFVLAWTFNGLMRPTYTWILSLMMFFPTIGLIWYIAKKKKSDNEKNI